MITTTPRLLATLGVILALGAATAACAYDPYGRDHGRRHDGRGDHHGGHHDGPGDHHDHH